MVLSVALVDAIIKDADIVAVRLRPLYPIHAPLSAIPNK
jgi:hypothetical protein